jgi:hypothetical protein
VRAGLTRAEGWAPRVGWLGRRGRGDWERGRWVPGQSELEVVQAGTRPGTPQPIVPACVEPLGPHVWEKAAEARERWQGHGLPALGLGILRAEAAVAVLDREPTAMGQREAVDIPSQVRHDLRGALHGGCAGDDPPLAPNRLGNDQVGPFLAYQR